MKGGLKMKRITSIILAVVLTLTFSFSTFAISISNSFKGPLTELDEDEYIFSFGKLGEDENPSEVGFKIGSRKYTLSDAALYKAKQSKTFGIGFQDNENVLGDSYNVIPYFIDENGEETTGESYTVNKAEFADLKAGVKLANIYVDGTPLSFFKETVKTYDYGISYEDMEVNNPTVTATAKEETSEVSYETFATGVNITVTSANGETDTYTVNFKPESASTTTKIAEEMGSKRRDSSAEIALITDSTYTTTIRNTSINQAANGTNPNRYGMIPYITFDIPENINYQDEIIFSVRLRTLNTVPSDLKIYAYEYNENVLPYYATEDFGDYGYLGKVLNPEGWSAYNEANQIFIDYSCDISDYIAKLVSLGKEKATIALYYDSDVITSLWKEYHAGTYNGPTDLSITLVTNAQAVQNSTAAAYKDGYPKLTYSTFDNYTPKNLATLSDIKVGGTSIAGFAEDKYEYAIGVEDINNLPEVTATAKYPNSDVNITTEGTSKIVTVSYGNYEATYTVNFGLLTETTKTSIYQAYKQIQRDESYYTAIALDNTNISTTLSVRAYANQSSSMSSNQSVMEFDLENDVIDTTKGVYLTIRAKANFANMPQELKICAYEYDPLNSIKRLGAYDLSYMGELIDPVALSERESTSNAQYADLTFDISSYVEKVQKSGSKTFKVIFGFDYDQIAEYQALYKANNYTYTVTDYSFSVYPNTAKVAEYLGSGNAAFDGAAPRLTYKKIAE